MRVLALNMGSTGLKAGYFDASGDHIAKLAGVSVDSHDDGTGAASRAEALLDALTGTSMLDAPPDLVAHRIVHGGDRDGPTRLTVEELASLEALSTLAPMHQAPELALVRAALHRWPDSEHLAVFDTSWHRTMADVHQRFPLTDALHERGVRRYGFHGLAFASGMSRIAELVPSLASGRIVLAHLGGGSSLCAIRGGVSVSTTMGMTPLGGVAMGTRPGSLDPGVVLHLQRKLGLSNDEIDHLLWRGSGLLGMSGESSDMRRLLESGAPRAQRAIAVYVALVAQGVAAMATCVGGIDVLGFSGGIGQHAAEVRTWICEQLEWIGVRLDRAANAANQAEVSADGAPVRTLVLPIDEEHEMVREATRWIRRASPQRSTLP